MSNDAGPERLLPAEVEILPGVDVASLWDRFELFEALHHTAHNTADDTAHNTATPGPGAIATPMSSADLDGVVEAIAPQAGERALDLACGYGELLRRLRSRVMIAGRGVDLSPWMLAAAARTGETDLGWTLGGAKEYLARTPTPAWDIVCCLGASWIWYGLHGTIRAVAAATAPGGRVAIGDLHLRDGIDPETVVRSHGRVDDLPRIGQWFDDHGIDLVERVSTSDASWAAYRGRVDRAAVAWADRHPGPQADRWLREAAQWRQDQLRDQAILTWSVWVGRKRAS